MSKYARLHNKLAEARNWHNGRLYSFPLSIYNSNGSMHQRWKERMHLLSVRSSKDNIKNGDHNSPMYREATRKIKKHLVIKDVVFGLYPRLML